MEQRLDKDLEGIVRGSGREIELDDHLPLEAPAKAIEEGPLYRSIGEVEGDLQPTEGPGSEASADDSVRSSLSTKAAVDRRDFLKLFSSSALIASTAACVRRPIETAVPYVDQPADQVLGKPVTYATTSPSTNGTGLLVKTREGRPVIIEGNPSHPLSQGATSSQEQASIVSLYSPERPKAPQARIGNGKLVDGSWEDVLERLAGDVKGKKVAIFTGGSTGHRNGFFRDWLTKIGSDPKLLYTYESQPLVSSIVAAHKLAFGVEASPRASLNKSSFVVGFGSAFQDAGVMETFDTKSFYQGQDFRRSKKGRFVQFESRYTNTGTAATDRYPIHPGDELLMTLAFVRALLGEDKKKGSKAEIAAIEALVVDHGAAIDEALARAHIDPKVIKTLAQKAIANGKAVILAAQSGAADENATRLQLAAICANILVGSYGNGILNLKRGWLKPRTALGDLERFIKDAGANAFDALIVIDSNPAFTIPESTGIREVLKAVPTLVSIQSFPTETCELAGYRLNGHHFLESWGDEEPVAGFHCTRQPTVRPFTDSRQAEDILLWLAAKNGQSMGLKDYRQYLKQKWKPIHAKLGKDLTEDRFFDVILRTGFVGKLDSQNVGALQDISRFFKDMQKTEDQLSFSAYLDPRLTDGAYAEVPILQEAPDALTSICWDTWVALSPKRCRELGVQYNSLVKITGANGKSVEAAVYPLPGLHDNTVAMPRGNGHNDSLSKVTAGLGIDPLQLLAPAFDPLSGAVVTAGQKVTVEKTGRFYYLCATQKHNDIANRTDILKFVSEEKLVKNQFKTKNLDDVPDLYPKLEKGEYFWGMSVDFSRCNGCSACSIACSIENNVPTVGREQIMAGRTMTWIRSDRYFSGPVDNPKVNFQPVMCQQCQHAPCEPVCPVFATSHDPNGINIQTYNRCVGTRYCANSCPYKVRRFNWFTHKWNVVSDNPLDRNIRALNPEVTVRTRGVMEKCTFCIQRIREARHEAKKEGRKVRDGEVVTACEMACPSNAIVFGDLKNPASRSNKLRKDYRAYLMLNGDHEHKHYGIKTLPNVSYLAAIETPALDGSDAGAVKGGHGAPEGKGKEGSDKPAANNSHG